MEEDIDMRNQMKSKNIPTPVSSREAASKLYVETIRLY